MSAEPVGYNARIKKALSIQNISDRDIGEFGLEIVIRDLWLFYLGVAPLGRP